MLADLPRLGMQFTPPEVFLPTMARCGPLNMQCQPVPHVRLDTVFMPLQVTCHGMTHMKGSMAMPDADVRLGAEPQPKECPVMFRGGHAAGPQAYACAGV